MTTFSVPVTDASSRKMGAPRALPSDAVTPFRRARRAEAGERVDVGVEPPAADDVTARRWDDRPAMAGERRPGKADGCADAAAELLVHSCFVSPSFGDPDLAPHRRARPPPPRSAARSSIVSTSRDQRRDVSERHRLVGEEACGHDRQRRVLVSGRARIDPRKRPHSPR